ncbi:polysaccharide biosynthesis C-terminal domain-containing protein [Candidatus Marifrigoribacter sp. Uisw_064]|jgi:O-antigen/teichoic acid export membrane protein|uniref:lipopolysaccharide biosynthesis protein n=1 Tax=Candidatus Marifrigoribacter sp. Uisw_064 TaxID=3230970 RepID=UPI003D40D121
MSSKKFLKNIFLNNSSQGLQFGSRWIFNITLINVLDIGTYGVFSFVYSISNTLLAVIPFGSPVFLINEVDDLKASKNKLLDSFWVASILFLGLLAIYLILNLFLENIKGWNYVGYGVLLGFVLSLNMILFSFFKGVGDFAKELRAYTVFFLCLIAFIAYLFFFETSIKNIHFIFGVLIGINALVFFLTFFSNKMLFQSTSLKDISQSRKRIKKAFSKRKYFGFQEIATAVYTQSGMLLLFYLLDENTYGYYRALFVIISPLFLFTVALSQVVLNYLKKQDRKSMISNFRKIQVFSFLIGVAAVLVLFFLKDFIFKVIKVPTTQDIIIAFKLVLATALLRFIFSNYEMLIIIYDKQKYRFYAVLVIAVINIILVFSLLPQYGIIGAVLTNFISYLLLLTGLLFITERTLKHK